LIRRSRSRARPRFFMRIVRFLAGNYTRDNATGARSTIFRSQVLSSSENLRLYECMRVSTTSGFITVKMENPALEFEDFDRLVEQYRGRVLRFLFVSVHDLDLAETLTQDCFWNAYQSRKTFRGDCSVNTWLMRIAINLVRSH